MSTFLSREERRAAIAAKLESGELPSSAPTGTQVEAGRGRSCAACDGSISEGETEFRVDFGGAASLHAHAECFAEWRRLAIHRLIVRGP